MSVGHTIGSTVQLRDQNFSSNAQINPQSVSSGPPTHTKSLFRGFLARTAVASLGQWATTGSVVDLDHTMVTRFRKDEEFKLNPNHLKYA